LVAATSGPDLAALKKDQRVADFRVANLYSDSDGRIVGAKFWHVPSGVPVFLLQIETVPQAYMWVDTPVDSDRGLPHALEHLLAEKGTKGRYFALLKDMRLSQSAAATWRDFNFYSFSSGSGMDGFFEVLHAWLDALYYPDFTDAEAEREFYHFGIATDPRTKIRTLTEGGSVYNEEQTEQGEESCYHDLDKRVLGKENPLAANIGGTPDQMRSVTPHDIREFHRGHYHLGPTTGFIFAIHPKENVLAFLQKVSGEFGRLPQGSTRNSAPQTAPGSPKYPIHSSENIEPQVCVVPGANEDSPADIWFAWKPKVANSMIAPKLLELLYRRLVDGQRSLLYKSLVDSKMRETDTGATSVTMDPAHSESPRYMSWKLDVSGIPGNRISVEKITQVGNAIRAKIREVSEYPDHSEALTGFNSLILSYAQGWRRSNGVWMRNPPLFGVLLDANWKDLFEYLEMDSSFVRSLSEDELWKEIERELKSGKNIWRDLIHEFNLLDLPYASATPSSPQLLQKLESEKQERISNNVKSLREHYHAPDDQEALARFEQDELLKTNQIDQIESRVPKPHFTEHPPLTPDDEIQYSQLQIAGVPAIAGVFDRPPTIELGLSFDLRQIPKKYYRYLPILARSFDSLGLKEGNQITPYSDVLGETQSRFVGFAAGTADNAISHRADFTFRASVTSVPEFREALRLIDRSLRSSYLDPANVGRLRDIVSGLISADDSYTKQDEFSWVFTPAQAFRYQGDTLYLALESQFTKAHWDGRLRWLLHEPVSPEEIDRLGAFATRTLSTVPKASKPELTKNLNAIDAKGLERELVDHWRRNLDSFPEDKLVVGLQGLVREVQQDLRTGPVKAISELRELQQLVINRRTLNLDLLVSPSALLAIQPDLAEFVKSIPDRPLRDEAEPVEMKSSTHPIIDNLIRKNGLADQQFPWYLGLVAPEEGTGNAIFYSDFINYSQLDRNSLLRLLSSAILAGRGPDSLYMKSREAGLAYALLMRADPARGLIGYYADRSLDLPSLISALNSGAEGIANMQDPYLVDYAFRQTFSIPRSIYTFPIRERVLAQEIRDGNAPEKVRRFYEALLRLRKDPDLLSELRHAGRDSLCGILLEERCKAQQQGNHSIFFFVGSEQILSDAEKRFPIPKLLRLWPSDYWLP
jgi:Zn-dependent M16 (insulinase) family peptidase